MPRRCRAASRFHPRRGPSGTETRRYTSAISTNLPCSVAVPPATRAVGHRDPTLHQCRLNESSVQRRGSTRDEGRRAQRPDHRRAQRPDATPVPSQRIFRVASLFGTTFVVTGVATPRDTASLRPRSFVALPLPWQRFVVTGVTTLRFYEKEIQFRPNRSDFAEEGRHFPYVSRGCSAAAADRIDTGAEQGLKGVAHVFRRFRVDDAVCDYFR